MLTFFKKIFGNDKAEQQVATEPIIKTINKKISDITLSGVADGDVYGIYAIDDTKEYITIINTSCKKDELFNRKRISFDILYPSSKSKKNFVFNVPFEEAIVQDICATNIPHKLNTPLVLFNTNSVIVNQKLLEIKKNKYFNIPFIEEDPFSETVNLKWENVGGIDKWNDLGKYGVVTSSEDAFLLIISFARRNDKIYLVVNYFTDKLSSQHTRFKIYENDEIEFLFDDKSKLKFTITDKTVKPLDKTEQLVDNRKITGLHQNSIEINEHELNVFADKKLIAWKLTVKKFDLQIIGNDSGHTFYESSDWQFVLNNLAIDFINIIKLEKDEIKKIINEKSHLKKNEYGFSKEFDPDDRDPMFEDAARLIVLHQQGSTSLIQRKLKLGYNRAGRIINQLEAAGIVGPFEGSKARDVLYPDEYSLERHLESLGNKD